MGDILLVSFHVDSTLKSAFIVPLHRQQAVLYDLNGAGAWRGRVVIGVRDIDGSGTVFRA